MISCQAFASLAISTLSSSSSLSSHMRSKASQLELASQSKLASLKFVLLKLASFKLVTLKRHENDSDKKQDKLAKLLV